MKAKEQLEKDKISVLEKTIIEQKRKINSLSIQLRNIKKDYESLLKRYIKQNEELTLLMLKNPVERIKRGNTK